MSNEQISDCRCGNVYLAIRTDLYKDGREFVYCDCCGALADHKTWQAAGRAFLAGAAEPVGELVEQDTMYHGWSRAFKPSKPGRPPPPGTLLYTHPPQVPLTDERIEDACAELFTAAQGPGPIADKMERIGSILRELCTTLTAEQCAAATAEVKALRKKAARYDWLREQPNNTDAPRIDVVYWTAEDQASNSGEGLRLETLDAAIDAAMEKEAKNG